jgi:SAM-dependent methyltransferase
VGALRFDSLSPEQLADLDRLVPAEDTKWTGFYTQRTRPCPFFVDGPDESLAEWCAAGRIRVGHAFDVGCGNGRNATYLARAGFRVHALDYSASAVAWARDRAAVQGVQLEISQCSVFQLDAPSASADLLYDSGCFHHMPPHRRGPYIQLAADLVRPGGHLGLVCFRPEGGSGYSDEEVYAKGSLGGGLGYTEEQLRELWSPHFQFETIRPMHDHPVESDRFGRSFLWACLARRC